MEYVEIISEKGETTVTNSEKDENLEEKIDFNQKIDEKYILICSKKGKRIKFKLQLEKAIIPINYELICDYDYMKDLSGLYKLCPDIDKIYEALITDLKLYINDIKIEIINDNIQLNFIIDYKFITKKENISLTLIKKKENLNTDILNNEFIKINNNQKILEEKLENKIKEINLISEKQKQLQDEFQQKLKEIEQIKNAQNDYLNLIKNNQNNFNELKESQNKIRTELDKLKNNINNNKNDENISKEIKKEISNLKNIIDNQNNNFYNSITKNNLNIRNLSENSSSLKTSIEENNKLIEKIQKVQDKLILENSNINKNIKDIELNTENNYQKLLEDNKSMKNNITKLTNNYNLLYEEIEELKNESIIPTDFEYKKTISNDIFKRNFYGNRACIFISCDNKVYIAFGESSLDLKGYDIDKDEKFTIYEKLHEEFFDSIRYYYDNENDRDLLITASLDSHVKVIDFKRKNSEKIIDLNFNSKNKVIINTAYFINDIILIPFSSSTEGTIKFYNMNEEFISELEENVGFVLALNVYYDEKSKSNYILIANTVGVFSYNMEQSSISKFIPKMTFEEKKNCGFDEPFIVRNGNKLLLLGPSFYHPYLYIWNFTTGDLIKKVDTTSGLSDMCLWNNTYAFAGLTKSDKNNFILINIKEGKIVKSFKKETNNSVAGIKVIKHESGTYLITANMKSTLDLYVL